MAVSLKHKFVPALADSGDAGEVSTNAWTDEHDLIVPAGEFLVGTGTGVEGQDAATARATMGAEASGAAAAVAVTAAAALAAHEAAANPHPGYLTPAEGDAAYSALGHSHSGLAPSGGSTGYVLKKNSGTDYDYGWAADATGGGGGGGLVDGDFGDIVVSGTGTVMTIDSGVLSTFGRSLIDDANVSTARGTLGLEVANLTALIALSANAFPSVWLRGRSATGDGGEGLFYWNGADLSAQVTIDTQQAVYVAPSSASTGASGAWVRDYSGALNAHWFGATPSVSAADLLTAETALFLFARTYGRDMYFPAGTYQLSAANHPFRQSGTPGSLLNCNGITLFGDGPATLFSTTSVNGADVFQINGIDNFGIRNVATTGTVSGSASGTNGFSITNGFDRLSILDVYCFDLPSIDQTTFVDGGKALTIQCGTTANTCGSLTARIRARNCSYGFGSDYDLPTSDGKTTLVDVQIDADSCYRGISISGGAPGSALDADQFSQGFRVRGVLRDCQQSVGVSRAVGVDIDVLLVSSKTAANKRLNGSSVAWITSDTVVHGLNAVMAHDSNIAVRGDVGDCDYKAQIGGATAGTSGYSGASENTRFTIDLTGTAATSDINIVNSGGNRCRYCIVDIGYNTTATAPADLLIAANANTVRHRGIDYGVTYNAAAGTAALPAYATLNDPDTGLWFPTANTLAASSGGTEYWRLNASGNFGLGTTAPVTKFHSKRSNINGSGLALCAIIASDAKTANDGVNLGFYAVDSADNEQSYGSFGCRIVDPTSGTEDSQFEVYVQKTGVNTKVLTIDAFSVVNAEQVSILIADFTGTDVATAQPVFSASQDTVTLAASTTYEFEAKYWITRAAGTTSHTTGVLFGGTATFTSFDYIAQVTNPTGNVLAATQQINSDVATLTTLTAANTSATENVLVHLRGTIRVNAAGTVIPQFQFSAAPGGAPTIKKNSFFRCWAVGTNTVAAVGNWA